jgi:hypothetical protein
MSFHNLTKWSGVKTQNHPGGPLSEEKASLEEMRSKALEKIEKLKRSAGTRIKVDPGLNPKVVHGTLKLATATFKTKVTPLAKAEVYSLVRVDGKLVFVIPEDPKGSDLREGLFILFANAFDGSFRAIKRETAEFSRTELSAPEQSLLNALYKILTVDTISLSKVSHPDKMEVKIFQIFSTLVLRQARTHGLLGRLENSLLEGYEYPEKTESLMQELGNILNPISAGIPAWSRSISEFLKLLALVRAPLAKEVAKTQRISPFILKCHIFGSQDRTEKVRNPQTRKFEMRTTTMVKLPFKPWHTAWVPKEEQSSWNHMDDNPWTLLDKICEAYGMLRTEDQHNELEDLVKKMDDIKKEMHEKKSIYSKLFLSRKKIILESFKKDPSKIKNLTPYQIMQTWYEQKGPEKLSIQEASVFHPIYVLGPKSDEIIAQMASIEINEGYLKLSKDLKAPSTLREYAKLDITWRKHFPVHRDASITDLQKAAIAFALGHTEDESEEDEDLHVT